jgi:hypothetical protein
VPLTCVVQLPCSPLPVHACGVLWLQGQASDKGWHGCFVFLVMLALGAGRVGWGGGGGCAQRLVPRCSSQHHQCTPAGASRL